MKQEEWKPIKGYEGLYEISDRGNVKSLLNRYTGKHNRLMRPDVGNKGYHRVRLAQPTKKFLVHRLVAQAFLPNPEFKATVNHIDNNPRNNSVANLEWATQSENLQHAQNQSRLTEAQSNGGKSRGADASAEAKDLALSLIGTTTNSWTVISYVGKLAVGKTASRETLECRCQCGLIQNIHSSKLTSGKATMCRQCAKNQVSKARYDELVAYYTDVIIGTWHLTGYVSPYITGDTVRAMKFEAMCVVCNTHSVIPQQSVIGLKSIKQCPTCKKKNNKVKI